MDLDSVIKKYPVVNTDWKYCSDTDTSLNSHIFMEIQYNNLPDKIYSDVTHYFVRKKYKSNYDSYDYTRMRLDPWNRQFKCFPFDKMFGNNTFGWDGDVYGWCSIRDIAYKQDRCYVITTTVYNKKIYCLDILNDINKI